MLKAKLVVKQGQKVMGLYAKIARLHITLYVGSSAFFTPYLLRLI